MLKYRLITAIILIPLVVLGILYLPPLAFALITALIVGACAYEWASLIKFSQWWQKLIFAIIVIASLGIFHFVPIDFWLYIALGFWVWAFTGIICYAARKMPMGFQNRIIQGLSAFFALIPFWVSLNVLRLTENGPLIVIYFFILVWAVDSAGYFVGRSIGKQVFIPRVSPKKTWAGLMGGFIIAIVLSITYSGFYDLTLLQSIVLIAIALITAVFSVIGDLFESLLKRQADIKDSSHLLPGHGGLFDRLDSAIAALPIFTLCLWLFR